MTYTMDIETNKGVAQHPYHLGTDIRVAESFVFEHLNRGDVISVALRQNGRLIRIYDGFDIFAEERADAAQADRDAYEKIY